jgi:Flp pilus assembly protein TadD
MANAHRSDNRWAIHCEAYSRADRYFNAGEYRTALGEFRRALLLWPHDPDTLWGIGNCHTELRRPRLAERAFRKALKSAPESDREALVFNLANSLFDQGRYAAAARLYRRMNNQSNVGILARRNRVKASQRARSNFAFETDAVQRCALHGAAQRRRWASKKK